MADGIILLAALFFAFMGVLILWEMYFDCKHGQDIERQRLRKRIDNEFFKIYNEPR